MLKYLHNGSTLSNDHNCLNIKPRGKYGRRIAKPSRQNKCRRRPESRGGSRPYHRKQTKYEEYFTSLDSLFLIDLQIKNILGLFLEDDTSKINAVLEKTRLNPTKSVKNEIDFEGRYGWIPLAEKIKAEKIPDIIPVSGVISKKYSEKEKHLGVDFAAKNEDPIYASASGVVISVNETEDLGLTIKIYHQNGYVTSYSHLGKASVKQGKKVEKGDLIGVVGSTGKTTGPHLHYVIQKDGKYINPETFFNY